MSVTNLALAPAHALLAGPLGSFEAYADRVSRIPVLSREEERELATKFLKNDDLEAARTLVMSHLRFVLHIARGYSGYGLPVGDLVQEGNVGLMKAVKRFDPDQGVRLVSFAVHWIRAEIEVTKLVGGSNAFVRRPFLYTGLYYGLLGALIAALLVLLGLSLLNGPVTRLATSYGSDFRLLTPDLGQVAALLGIGGGLGLVGSWLAAARHLARIEPRA